MPPTCTICRHPKREAIDAALVRGEPYRRIAARTGTSMGSVRRHQANHLAAAIADAKQAKTIRADNLLDQVRVLHERTLEILDRALATGAPHIALNAVREARANIELLATMTGELEQRQTNVNVAVVNVDPASVAGLREQLAAKLATSTTAQLPAATPKHVATTPTVIDAKIDR